MKKYITIYELVKLDAISNNKSLTAFVAETFDANSFQVSALKNNSQSVAFNERLKDYYCLDQNHILKNKVMSSKYNDLFEDLTLYQFIQMRLLLFKNDMKWFDFKNLAGLKSNDTKYLQSDSYSNELAHDLLDFLKVDVETANHYLKNPIHDELTLVDQDKSNVMSNDNELPYLDVFSDLDEDIKNKILAEFGIVDQYSNNTNEEYVEEPIMEYKEFVETDDHHLIVIDGSEGDPNQFYQSIDEDLIHFLNEQDQYKETISEERRMGKFLAKTLCEFNKTYKGRDILLFDVANDLCDFLSKENVTVSGYEDPSKENWISFEKKNITQIILTSEFTVMIYNNLKGKFKITMEDAILLKNLVLFKLFKYSSEDDQ